MPARVRRCTAKCPICSKRCFGAAAHDCEHQCDTHFWCAGPLDHPVRLMFRTMEKAKGPLHLNIYLLTGGKQRGR